MSRATLGFSAMQTIIVQQEIERFVPKQSWVLSTLYRDTKFTAIAHDEEAEAEDAAEVKAAAEQGKTIKGKGPIYRRWNTPPRKRDERCCNPSRGSLLP